MREDDREIRLSDFADDRGRSLDASPYQTFYENSPSILLASDVAGILVAANRFGAAYLGFRSDDLIGRSVLDLVHPEDRGEYLAHLRAALDQPGEIIRAEVRKVRGDGAVIWVRDSLRAVGAGTDRLVLQSCEDITQRIEAQDAVRERDRRLHELTDHLREAFWITDPEFSRFAFISPAFEAIWGREREPYCENARAIFEAADPADRDRIHSALERMRHEVTEVEFSLTRPDGSRRRVLSRGYPVRNEQRVAERIVGVTEDVTDRRRIDDRQRLLVDAGRVLAASLDYETTLQNVADLAVSSLADWCVIDLCEDSGGDLRRVALAHRDPKMVGVARSFDEEYPPDRTARQSTIRTIRQGTSELIPEIPDSLLVQAARDERHLELLRALGMKSGMVVPLKIRERALGAITFIGTTPGEKFDEQDLETAELLASRAALAIEKARLFRDAQEASRLRDEVLSVVSHDLRNPLNTITLSSGFLHEVTPGENKAVRKQLEIIQRSAAQMERLIQDLLDVAQIESGRLPVQLELENVASLIAEACHTFRPLAEGKGVHLACEVPGTLGAIPVDRNRLSQVFSNLIGNAVKFTGKGGEIVVSAEETGEWVRFTVRDNGIGIEPLDLPHLFDRFYQSQKTKRGGAGLGLAIVKGIVDAHGGHIHVNSRVGEGSVFTFELPHSAA